MKYESISKMIESALEPVRKNNQEFKERMEAINLNISESLKNLKGIQMVSVEDYLRNSMKIVRKKPFRPEY